MVLIIQLIATCTFAGGSVDTTSQWKPPQHTMSCGSPRSRDWARLFSWWRIRVHCRRWRLYCQHVDSRHKVRHYLKLSLSIHPTLRAASLLNVSYVPTRALETLSLLGGEDLEPFYAMLDGGRGGEFFAELEEYFYYAQIRRWAVNECHVLTRSENIL